MTHKISKDSLSKKFLLNWFIENGFSIGWYEQVGDGLWILKIDEITDGYEEEMIGKPTFWGAMREGYKRYTLYIENFDEYCRLYRPDPEED